MEWRGFDYNVKVSFNIVMWAEPTLNELREAYCEMKIKEKGLTGRAALNRKDSIASNRKGFNAFKELEREKKGASGASTKPKPEIWLEFMGNKIRVHEEEGAGMVKKDEVPLVRGGTLKFSGSGVDVKYDQIKVRASLISTVHGANLIRTHYVNDSLEFLTSNSTVETIGVSWVSTSHYRRKTSLLSRRT